MGGSPFKTEEERTKGDVKEERSHLRSRHGPRKLCEASSAALSAPAQFRHLFPFIFFLLASFLPPFLLPLVGALAPDDPQALSGSPEAAEG